MTCPDCGGQTRVYRTYYRSNGVKRQYHRCANCGEKNKFDLIHAGKVNQKRYTNHQNGRNDMALWSEAQLALRRQMTQATYDFAIAPTRLVSWHNGQVIVAAPPNAKEWLDNRLYPMIEQTLAHLGEVNQIKFVEDL